METLLTHVFIEMYCDGGKGLLLTEHLLSDADRRKLFEAYGVFDGCEECARKLAETVLLIKKNESRFGDKISVNTEGLLGFTDNVWLDFTDSENVGGIYLSDESNVNEEGKFDHVLIEVGIGNNDFYSLYKVFLHELTHAYQDYCMRQNTGETLRQYNDRVGYDKMLKPSGNPTSMTAMYEGPVRSLLYHLHYFESGAYMTEFTAEAERLSNVRYTDIDHAIKALKKTDVYMRYRKLNDSARAATNKSAPDIIKYGFLDAANRLSGYNFATFDDWCRWVYKRLCDVNGKIDRNIPKIACQKMNITGRIYPSDRTFNNESTVSADVMLERAIREYEETLAHVRPRTIGSAN